MLTEDTKRTRALEQARPAVIWKQIDIIRYVVNTMIIRNSDPIPKPVAVCLVQLAEAMAGPDLVYTPPAQRPLKAQAVIKAPVKNIEDVKSPEAENTDSGGGMILILAAAAFLFLNS